MSDSKYVQVTTHHPFGPVKLTIYTPQDVDWIERHIHSLQVDLHTVQSAIVTIANSFIVLEREIDHDELHFAVQTYRTPDSRDDGTEDIEVDILAGYPAQDSYQRG